MVGEKERQSGFILSHHRMVSVGDGGWLSRIVGGCRMRTRMVIGGEIIARPSTILSRKIGAVVLRGGAVIGCHREAEIWGWEWLSRAER